MLILIIKKKEMEKIYSIGIVYAIKTHNSNDIYIGSTVLTLKQRLSKHFSDYNKYLQTQVKRLDSFCILEQGNIFVETMEEYEDITILELRKKEGIYIKKMDCVNKQIPGRTRKEHYEDNCREILAKAKVYCEANKDKIKARNDAYYEANKARLREKRLLAKQLKQDE